MAPSETPNRPASGARLAGAARVLIVSSVMFTFISYWRTAAVVLCDMSSTVYYLGAIVESAIGKAAPWFILAVLLFSYAMRSVYIESCALFVRGGVYKVVKEAMGGFLAKLSVSALMFDYILTGPISGVSAGQYIVGLGLETLRNFGGVQIDADLRDAIKAWGSVLIACAITVYFFRQNLLGIHESSDKALKIMKATTVMAVVMLIWCGVTLAVQGPVNRDIPWEPDLSKKVEVDAEGKVKLDENGQPVPRLNSITGKQEDPLGFLGNYPSIAEPIRNPGGWLSLIGIVGLIFAFGHSILAMSGEETLAQVYREVESPKLPNFQKAAFIVFLYSLLLTGTFSFLAVLLIPDHLRMGEYYDNFVGGLAMQMVGPLWARLLLNAFVVVVGFLILSGAVNTSIIGSNGVLNRVAEDGVLPDWFLKPHHRYGTTSRILYLITALQLFTIIASRGDVILLGEAYAFGVIWSFVFKTLSMVVLRFRDKSPREFKVPGNIRIGSVELPIGLGLIFLLMLLSAIANLLTKEVATISGLIFTAVFLAVFVGTEFYYERKRRGAKHEHREQFNQEVRQEVSAAALGLTKRYRKLVAIRSTQNLVMLEKALADTDPFHTDVVVMTAKIVTDGKGLTAVGDLDAYDQELMTAVVQRAEKSGKHVVPLIISTNNPLHTLLKTAMDLQVQEVVVGASNKYTADEQVDQISFYWINLHGGEAAPLSVRILGPQRDVQFDLGGGNRIPRLGEARARSVADLRAAGIGVQRVLLALEEAPRALDQFQDVLTMLDPAVELHIALPETDGETARALREQAEQVERAVAFHAWQDERGPDLVCLAQTTQSDAIIAPVPLEDSGAAPAWVDYILGHAPCPVLLAHAPTVPQEVVG